MVQDWESPHDMDAESSRLLEENDFKGPDTENRKPRLALSLLLGVVIVIIAFTSLAIPGRSYFAVSNPPSFDSKPYAENVNDAASTFHCYNGPFIVYVSGYSKPI